VERWCDMAVWIDGGRVAECGDPRRVVAAYRQRVAEREMASEAPAALPVAAQAALPEDSAPPATANRWGSRKVHFEAVRLLDAHGAAAGVLTPESAACLELDFVAAEGAGSSTFSFGIFRADGLQLYGSNSRVDRAPLPSPLPARGTLRVRLERLGLLEGNYTVDVSAAPEDGPDHDYWRGVLSFAVRTDVKDLGVVRLPHHWELA